MILAETWLEPNTEDSRLQIDDFSLSLNSVGRGKGLAVFFKDSKFQVAKVINCTDIQITKLEGDKLTIIALYRSHGNTTILDYLKELIPEKGSCLAIGDVNICMQSQPSHEIFQRLRKNNFVALMCEATHFKGGHIDQAWYRGDTNNCLMKMYCPYYTCKDHDALLFVQHGQIKSRGMCMCIYLYFSNICVER